MQKLFFFLLCISLAPTNDLFRNVSELKTGETAVSLSTQVHKDYLIRYAVNDTLELIPIGARFRVPVGSRAVAALSFNLYGYSAETDSKSSYTDSCGNLIVEEEPDREFYYTKTGIDYQMMITDKHRLSVYLNRFLKQEKSDEIARLEQGNLEYGYKLNRFDSVRFDLLYLKESVSNHTKEAIGFGPSYSLVLNDSIDIMLGYYHYTDMWNSALQLPQSNLRFSFTYTFH